MALVNPNIAMSFRQPEFKPRNALAEYAQIQQIQGGQRQAEVADMQLRRMRQEDEDIERIHQIAMKNGGPDSRMEMGRALFASRNPTQRELGYKIIQHEEAKTAFKAAETQFGYAPGAAAAAPAMPSSAPGTIAAPAELAAGAQPEPMAPVPGVISTSRVPGVTTAPISMPAAAGEGVRGIVPANTLAPPAAAPVNAMLAPSAAAPTKGKTLEQLQREYMAYSSLEKLGVPGAAGRLKIIEQQMEDARKAFEVKGRLITRDGTVLYESPADPTNIAILEREVAALLKGGALPTDPRIAVRQSAIAQAAGQNTELMRNYSAAKAQGFRGTIFDYERQIKEAGRAPRPEPALRTQQVTMSDGTLGIVNMDTGVITPSTVGGAPVKGKANKDLAVSEQQASYNLGRILDAAKEINAALKKDPNALKPGMGEASAASVGLSGTANVARSAQRQIVYGAQRDALDAMLYLATGAAYNKEQLEGQMAAYVPAFTDKPDAVEAKRVRMLGLIQNAKVRAGKAWTPEMDAASQALLLPVASSAKLAGGNKPPAAPGASNVTQDRADANAAIAAGAPADAVRARFKQRTGQEL